jgi:two-component system sensor histidine kinase DesK
LHLPFVVAGPVTTIPRYDLGFVRGAGLAVVAAAIGGLQLRHSLATARGERPADWPVTFLALAALVYVPMWWFTWDWQVMQWFVVASGAMLLRDGLRVVAVVGPLVVTPAVAVWLGLDDPTAGFWLIVVFVAYMATLLVMGSAALYGSVRLVQVLDDLGEARTELADLAVGQERLRVARDLHDLLGQSLSAVSLKGDLALRLLPTDPAAARAEIAGLTEVARTALRDVRAVARDEHGVSLEAEVRAAEALLGAAGITTVVDVDGLVPDRAEAMLAWAVREGATNALRHSQATTWSVTLNGQGGRVQLDIVNDGVFDPGDPDGDHEGHGLPGVADRARALGGWAEAERLPGGRFRLRVEVPR